MTLPPGLKLDRLVVLVRHGARTTLSQVKAFPEQQWIMSELQNVPEKIARQSIQVKSLDGKINDPESYKETFYRNEPKLPGGGILGQLTTIGYNQAFDVGQYLREAYGPVSNDDVYIRSTNIYRTIETARGVFVGWNDAQSTGTVKPIFVEGDHKSEFMYPNGEMPFAGKSMRWIWEAPGLDSEIQKLNKTILETLKIDFDNDFSGRNPIYLRDDITARWEHGFKIESPNFTQQDLEGVMPLIQKCAADLLAKIGNDSDRVREASMATISGRLLDYITKTDNKYTILGAHDTTVGPMLSALKVDPSLQSYWPRYCAHIDFEFLSNEQNQQFVRVLYDEVPVTIGGASDTVITREQFDELTAWCRQTPEEWDQVKKSDDSNYDGLYTNEQVDDYISGKTGAISLN